MPSTPKSPEGDTMPREQINTMKKYEYWLAEAKNGFPDQEDRIKAITKYYLELFERSGISLRPRGM